MKKKYDPPKILTDEVEVSTVMTPGPDTTYTTGGGECGSPILPNVDNCAVQALAKNRD